MLIQEVNKAISEAVSIGQKQYVFNTYHPRIKEALEEDPNNAELKLLLKSIILLPPVPSSELGRPVNKDGEEVDSYIGVSMSKLEDEPLASEGMIMVSRGRANSKLSYEDGSRVYIDKGDEKYTYLIEGKKVDKLTRWANSGPLPPLDEEERYRQEMASDFISKENDILEVFAQHRDETVILSDSEFRNAHYHLYNQMGKAISETMKLDLSWAIKAEMAEYDARPYLELILEMAYDEYTSSTIDRRTFLAVLLRLSHTFGIGGLKEDGSYDYEIGPNKDLKQKYKIHLDELDNILRYQMVMIGNDISPYIHETELPTSELIQTVEYFHKKYMEQKKQSLLSQYGEKRGWVEYSSFEAYLKAVTDNNTPKRAAQAAKRVRSDLLKYYRHEYRKQKAPSQPGLLIRRSDGRMVFRKNGIERRVALSLSQQA